MSNHEGRDDVHDRARARAKAMRLSRCVAAAAAATAALLLGDCAAGQMAAPRPSTENTARLRGARLAPVQVGRFSFDPGMPAALDLSLGIRGSTLRSPIRGSFARYLGETLRVELDAAGLMDAAAPTVISGTLSESRIDAAIAQGSGRLAARFVVTRAGAVRYDRTLTASTTWESAFAGAVAIRLAATQYRDLYRKLAGQLFADPDFRKALAP